jgi:uncharacterized protein YaaQ
MITENFVYFNGKKFYFTLGDCRMLLLVVVVQSEDAGKLAQRLVEEGLRLTRINATGGFLATGNAVLLIGVEDEQLATVTGIIAATCYTRTRLLNAAPYPGMAGSYVMGTVAPVEVVVGGAVVFGFPVERFLRLGAGERNTNMMPDLTSRTDAVAAASTAADSGDPSAAASSPTKFVVAIVQKENSVAVVNALMDAGYRLTRIDTAGGFLRRGNATLLIGVDAARVEDVLNLIQANCRPRSEPTPIQEGMPSYSATVFVLDASHFLRF